MASTGATDDPRARRGNTRNAYWFVLAFLVTPGAAVTPDLYGSQEASSPVPSEVNADSSDGRKSGPAGSRFDHSRFDTLLHRHVDTDGWVDYRGLQLDESSLDTYIASLARTTIANLDRDEQLALLINAYNAFTLRLILDYYPVKSINDIPPAKRWKDPRWHLGSMTLSLDQLEHEQIRPKFKEPRIHFALVCAAIGCPKLRNEAFTGERLDEQLDDQARYIHAHDRWFNLVPGGKEVNLTKLYDWYSGDFEQVAGTVLRFAARYSPALHAALETGGRPHVRWLDYDWTLNDLKNKH